MARGAAAGAKGGEKQEMVVWLRRAQIWPNVQHRCRTVGVPMLGLLECITICSSSRGSVPAREMAHSFPAKNLPYACLCGDAPSAPHPFCRLFRTRVTCIDMRTCALDWGLCAC